MYFIIVSLFQFVMINYVSKMILKDHADEPSIFEERIIKTEEMF